MANDSTALFQTALKMLLQGREPSPLAPVPLAPTGDIGPLSMETTAALRALQPEPVPPALPSPVDTDAIRARFSGLAGPEPVAPVTQPDPLILKIARALQGFEAGTQGQGPQFLAALQEQRERPMREFKAETERFRSRGAELGLLAEQEIGRAEDRNKARTQELLDNQSDREFKAWARRLDIRDEEVARKAREVFDLQKLREQERAADERQLKAQKLAFSKELAGQIKFYKSNGVSDHVQARRLALNDYADVAAELGIEVPALSKGDNQRLATVQAKLDRQQRVGRGGAGGAASSTAVQRTVDEFNALKSVAIQSVKARGGSPQEEIEAINKATEPVMRRMAKRPDLFEFGVGTSGYMFAKPRGAQAPTATQAQLRQYATENSISIEAAREDFRKAGIQIVR